MSKFFEALEQAERDRTLREQSVRQEPAVEDTEMPGENASATVLPARPAERERAEPAAPARRDSRAEGFLRSTTALDWEPVGQVDDHLVSLLTPTAFGAEQYRAIRHVIEEQHKNGALTVVAISSPGLDEGKTTTAINLAGALAQAPAARVLLVEADLRRPSVMRYLGLDGVHTPGLVDVILKPGASLDSAVRVCAPFNLDVLPAGEAPSATYEVLKSPRLGELLDQARRRYDYVIVDTPPLCPIPDGRVVAKWVDGVLLVVAAHKTPRKLVEEALELLPAPPIGIVFNGDDHRGPQYYPGYARAEEPGRWMRLWGRWNGR
ncbi:MAG: CpsD/CapB family tyrosine-protein kinase [Candidatus Rokuibacteriota bacterium]